MTAFSTSGRGITVIHRRGSFTTIATTSPRSRKLSVCKATENALHSRRDSLCVLYGGLLTGLDSKLRPDGIRRVSLGARLLAPRRCLPVVKFDGSLLPPVTDLDGARPARRHFKTYGAHAGDEHREVRRVHRVP